VITRFKSQRFIGKTEKLENQLKEIFNWDQKSHLKSMEWTERLRYKKLIDF
jgi:hypothetical protein